MATAQQLVKIINGVPVDELFATIDAITTTPSIAKFKFRIRTVWEGAGRNVSRVNEFYGAGQGISRKQTFLLEADEPSVLLSKDTAANPVEHLLHALAA